jgi:hypothetical protein
MVGHQRPCVTGRPGFNQNRLKPLEKIIPVEIGPKYFPPLYSPANDMVQRTSGINASFAWHVASISFNPQTCNSYFHTRPPICHLRGMSLRYHSIPKRAIHIFIPVPLYANESCNRDSRHPQFPHRPTTCQASCVRSLWLFAGDQDGIGVQTQREPPPA